MAGKGANKRALVGAGAPAAAAAAASSACIRKARGRTGCSVARLDANCMPFFQSQLASYGMHPERDVYIWRQRR